MHNHTLEPCSENFKLLKREKSKTTQDKKLQRQTLYLTAKAYGVMWRIVSTRNIKANKW